jgi:hypothetical protein
LGRFKTIKIIIAILDDMKVFYAPGADIMAPMATGHGESGSSSSTRCSMKIGCDCPASEDVSG